MSREMIRGIGNSIGNLGNARLIAVGMVLLLALSSVVILLPENASADRIAGGTLVNDEPAEASSSSWRTSDFLQFKVPTKTNYYTAIAVRNSLSGDDYDL